MERGSGSSRREWQWWPQGPKETMTTVRPLLSLQRLARCFAGLNHFLAKAQDGNRAALTQLGSGTEQLCSEGFGHVGKPPEPGLEGREVLTSEAGPSAGGS